jgi:hypothetical protein
VQFLCCREGNPHIDGAGMRLRHVEIGEHAPCLSRRCATQDMHQRLMSERREEVTKDGMISCHPCRIGRIALLDRLLVDEDHDLFVQFLLFTGDKII